jgi:DHA1 family multidrug resistance protein-like MFS transporter
MSELIRDTVLGHAIRIITRQKALPYEEDKNPSLWEQYINKEKSGNMVHHGHTGPADEEKEEENSDSNGKNEGLQPRQENNQGIPVLRSSRTSSDTRVASTDQQYNEVSGVPVDPEKGRDATSVTWFSDSDPEVSTIILKRPKSS